MNYDMRTSPEDGSQRMLNAMLPGTEVAVHRHPNSNENVILMMSSAERCVAHSGSDRAIGDLRSQGW